MRYVRIPVDDMLTIGDETAVLIHGQALRLSAVAAHLYVSCASPAALPELARNLVTTFGSPQGTDPMAATQSATDSLVAHGLLKVVSDDPGGGQIDRAPKPHGT